MANFEQLPMAVQKMWVHSHDEDKFREHAGAVVDAYNKALEAGALQSTAERAAAAVAYKIDDSGYREYIEHEKKWQLERCAAAAKLEELAMKARRLLKKAKKLVAAGTLPKRLLPFEDAFPPRQAMNIAGAIRDEVRCMRELIVQCHGAYCVCTCYSYQPCLRTRIPCCFRLSQGTVYGNTGTCGELRVRVVRGFFCESVYDVDRGLCHSSPPSRGPRDQCARGIAAAPGPADRPAIWLPFRELFPGSITLAPSPPFIFAAWLGHCASRAAWFGHGAYPAP